MHLPLSPVIIAAEVATVVKGFWSLRVLMLTKRAKCVKKSAPKMACEITPT